MTVPPLTAQALSRLEADQGASVVGGVLALGQVCAGARHHSPTPLVLHDTALFSGRRVLLCGTCVDNIAVLQRLMTTSEAPLPWPLRREFGNLVRALAEEGWEYSTEEVSGV